LGGHRFSFHVAPALSSLFTAITPVTAVAAVVVVVVVAVTVIALAAHRAKIDDDVPARKDTWLTNECGRHAQHRNRESAARTGRCSLFFFPVKIRDGCHFTM